MDMEAENEQTFSFKNVSLHFNRPISRWTWVSQYQNVSILDFKELRVMEVMVTTGAIRRA